ncbi:MAG: sigma 54-interacting transcriptional regulator [Candidatus Eisenbacteria sp.]|nr:sigma 54-interacting transcriptional regulator [Candidatus Eisenbacteria bacterium]
MTLEGLRYFGYHQRPAQIAIPVADLESFFASQPCPAVVLLREEALDRLLKASGKTIELCNKDHGGRQAKDSELAHYLLGKAAPAAIKGKYASAGRCKNGVRNLLMRAAGEKNLYFVGVSDMVFCALARGSIAEDHRSNTVHKVFQGVSDESERVRQTIMNIVRTAPKSHVLILGETGTGKDVIAELLHKLTRAGKPYVAVNVAEMIGDLFESRLFGHVRGAFTGAIADHAGYWEAAKDGTFFLDEIGELPLQYQAKILRALERREIYRVGTTDLRPVEARFVAATNRDLQSMVAKGEFRPELYARLCTCTIRTCTLRDNPDDVEIHVHRCWRQVWGEEQGKLPPWGIPGEIVEALKSAELRGNVRDIENLMRQIMIGVGREPPRLGHLEMVYRDYYGRPLTVPAILQEKKPALRKKSQSLASRKGTPSREWVLAQAGEYKGVREGYIRLANVLRQILEWLVRDQMPPPIIQSRVKTVSSYAERIQDECTEDSGPLNHLRDLCGLRIIALSTNQVQDICSLIARYFEIDRRESLVIDRRKTSAGSSYPHIHYVIRLDQKRAATLSNACQIEVPNDVLDLWAEVQVRTVLEHAWASVNQETSQRAARRPPDRWTRELSEIEHLLAAVDRSFERIRAGHRIQTTGYPEYMNAEQREKELERLQTVLECDCRNAPIAARIGKLLIALGDWDRAIRLLEDYEDGNYQPILRDLGVALCRKHMADPLSPEYDRGQTLLKKACELGPRDPDAHASLAGTWRRRGDLEQAHSYYFQAHVIDPADPYALGCYLETGFGLYPDRDLVTMVRPRISEALERCRDHIDASMNLPWAYYDLGKFLLLLGKPRRGLAAYARAVRSSSADFMIATSLDSLDLLAKAGQESTGLDVARGMLALCLSERFPSADAAIRRAETGVPSCKVTSPAVIVTGGLHGIFEDSASVMRKLLLDGFREFRGTLVSGGTTDEVRSILEHLDQSSDANPRVITYPTVGTVTDGDIEGEEERRVASEEDPCLREMLQGWTDVVTSQIQPSNVVLLDLDGYSARALEHAWAHALGARIVVIADENDTSAVPPDGADLEPSDVELLPRDAGKLGAFLQSLQES